MGDEQNVQSRKAYIFDIDGTLYSQKKMHCIMGFHLICFYLLHIKNLKELSVIFQFRKYREDSKYKKYSIAALSDFIAKERKIESSYVEHVIKNWLFDRPNNYMKKCAYSDVLEFINDEMSQGNIIVVYSDYPAEEKIAALGIEAEYVFSSEDPNIHELKPSKKAMDYILNTIGLPKKNILYIGDRQEKDGYSAKCVDIRYMDIHDFRKQINH